MPLSWHGVFPALTTQFHSDQSLNIPATLRHLELLIQAGIHGVIALGSVGENQVLDYEEKLELLQAVVHHVQRRIPVLSGVAENTTRKACAYAAEAQQAGANGLMVLPAMIYKSDPRETMTHFRAVARASTLPIMCYNNPPAYGVDITPEMFADLADEPTLVCIKESSGDVRRITDLHNLVGDRYILFSGVDDLVLESILLGVKGWVSGLVNAFPHENRALWDLATTGQWEQARALYRWYTPLLHLDTKIKLVQYIKLCMAETGLGTETTRAPRLPIEGEEREQVLLIIRQAIATRPNLNVRTASSQ